jgi:hypothetical protein
VIDGFIKAYQVAELDDRVARVERLSDAELLRIAASGRNQSEHPSVGSLVLRLDDLILFCTVCGRS